VDHGGPLAHLLLRYTLALIAQTGQVAACNRHHSLEQRLCRWLLSGLGRLSSNELAMKQELLAEMLGVRRDRISEAAANLKRQGLLRYKRGCIDIVDRRRLEAHVCECYAVVKREYDRLLPRRQDAILAAIATHYRREARGARCFRALGYTARLLPLPGGSKATLKP
jgi:hypothetical protein